MAPSNLSGEFAGSHPAQLLGFQGQPHAPEQHLLYGAADRGRTRQRSGPPADNGSGGFASGAVTCTVDGGPPAAPGFAGSSRVPRSASAPPGRMQQGPAGQADGQVLAQLQRTQQELQRQRAEQAVWAAAAQQLLRAHGHALPQAASPQDSQQQRRADLPPLPSPPGQTQRRPASLDLRPGSDLCQAFSSLQTDLGVIEQQQQDWEARWTARQAALAQEQAQWEARRAAEQWSWEMRRQAEEQAWRQARRQQEEAWLDKRRQEEREWLDKRRREEREQYEKRQRAEQQWQLECQGAQQQQQQQRQQQAAQRQPLPAHSQLCSKPPLSLAQGTPPATYSGSGNGSGSTGSCALPPPPLAPVMEGDSMQLDLLSFDSFDFMEMARELGLAPTPSFELLPVDFQRGQQAQQGMLSTLRNPASAPQPFFPLPVQQQPVGTAPGEPQPAGLGQRAQRAQHDATSPPASY